MPSDPTMRKNYTKGSTPHTCSTSSAGETSAGARPRSRPRLTSTPLFTNVPDAPGNVSHHYDSPSSAIIRAGKNRFLCDICGLEKTKTSDLLDHLSVKHQLGSPIVCKECKKNFTTKGSLKQHMRTQHQGNFKYNCEEHNWHSDNKAVYENHMVTKHAAAKEGPVSDYKCQKCQKVFTGKHLLSNHLHRGTCNLPKKIPCTLYNLLASRYLRMPTSFNTCICSLVRFCHTSSFIYIYSSFQQFGHACTGTAYSSVHVCWILAVSICSALYCSILLSLCTRKPYF